LATVSIEGFSQQPVRTDSSEVAAGYLSPPQLIAILGHSCFRLHPRLPLRDNSVWSVTDGG
jgi:hypothetical protein